MLLTMVMVDGLNYNTSYKYCYYGWQSIYYGSYVTQSCLLVFTVTQLKCFFNKAYVQGLCLI